MTVMAARRRKRADRTEPRRHGDTEGRAVEFAWQLPPPHWSPPESAAWLRATPRSIERGRSERNGLPLCLRVSVVQPVPRGKGKRSGKRFWREKLAANRRRDRWVTRQLRRHGWRVVRIWEHALTRKSEARVVSRILRALA